VRAAAASALRTVPRAALAIPAPVRRPLAIGLAALLVLWSLYTFWFKDSSFVRIDHVKITGLNTRDAHRIQAALTSAAHDMTTLHVRRDQLLAAVAGYTAVKDVVVTAHFPHSLTIKVVQERPVVMLQVDGGHMMLAADGSVLRGLRSPYPLPAIRSRGGVPQSKLTDPLALRELAVAAAAPRPLARKIAAVGMGATRGLVVKLRHGPQVVFGDDSQIDAKWAAAAAVLADSRAKGATYIDVRLPQRPVAGGLAAESLAPLDTASAAAAAARAQPTAAQLPVSAGATGPAGSTGPASGTTTVSTPVQTGTTASGGTAANPQP
jgi:cell division protein FtsQ